MTRHFIEHIRIKNFKCFEDLQIKGFARVNLFGGKNNVGKTALLEALTLSTSKSPHSLAYNLFRVLLTRAYRSLDEIPPSKAQLDLDMPLDIFNNYKYPILMEIPSWQLSILLEEKLQSDLFEKGSNLSIAFTVNDKKNNISLDQLASGFLPVALDKVNASNKCYIRASRLNAKEIAPLYGDILEKEKEDFFNESLSKFDSSLVSLKIIPVAEGFKAKLKVAGRDSLVSLSEMGDGISRYIAILCAIWSAQNGFLFIDEIENGIHYTNYPKLWNLIFDASEQANCQVFATSHSKECIEAFNQVQQAREAFKDAGCYFELFKSMKTGRITAAARGSEQLQYALEHGEEIRGE